MLADERRRELLDEINRTGHVLTSEAAARFGVSEVTIRTDLDSLERNGRLTRTYGGAVAVDTATAILGFDTRVSIRRDQKRRIALAARQLIGEGQTAIFDAGTTVHNLAQVMPATSQLTVYTPAITTAQQLLTVEGVDVHLLGGRLDARWLETVGTPTEQGIQGLLVHTLFMGVHSIDSDLDIADLSADLAENKRELAHRARKIVLLADSSKWGKPAPSKVMPLSLVDVVVTDDGLPEAIRRRVERLNVQLIIA